MDLNGKTVCITGGTLGIGAATAMRFAEAGADVVIAARNIDTDDARSVVQRIEESGRRCIAVQGDVADAEDCRAMIAACEREFGRLDVLVHNAGGLVRGGIFEITPEEWYRGFEIHVHAAFRLVRNARTLLTKNGGAIVLVSSVSGIRANKTHIGYQTVKGAIVQMTRALAYELADHGVRANCVAPGIIRTRFHAAMTSEAKAHNEKHRIPLHREGKPDEIARAVLELATNEYITGEMLVVDGGLTMRMA